MGRHTEHLDGLLHLNCLEAKFDIQSLNIGFTKGGVGDNMIGANETLKSDFEVISTTDLSNERNQMLKVFTYAKELKFYLVGIILKTTTGTNVLYCIVYTCTQVFTVILKGLPGRF